MSPHPLIIQSFDLDCVLSVKHWPQFPQKGPAFISFSKKINIEKFNKMLTDPFPTFEKMPKRFKLLAIFPYFHYSLLLFVLRFV